MYCCSFVVCVLCDEVCMFCSDSHGTQGMLTSSFILLQFPPSSSSTLLTPLHNSVRLPAVSQQCQMCWSIIVLGGCLCYLFDYQMLLVQWLHDCRNYGCMVAESAADKLMCCCILMFIKLLTCCLVCFINVSFLFTASHKTNHPNII